MTLTEQVNEQIKIAMKAKNQAELRGLRAIKAELIVLNTREGGGTPSETDELNSLVKMAKQRRDSMDIFRKQNREDLAIKEAEELEVIERFLPKQMSMEEIRQEVAKVIESIGAQGIKDMGKVMGVVSQALKGKADGKLIADVVKSALA